MKTVLLVEDHAGLAAISQRMLEALGYVVEHARSGASAWMLAINRIPDMILLDLSLPDMHGYRLAEKIRAECRFDDTILVALTGFRITGNAEQSRTRGIDAHFRKPMDFADLAFVKRALLAGAFPERKRSM